MKSKNTKININIVNITLVILAALIFWMFNSCHSSECAAYGNYQTCERK